MGWRRGGGGEETYQDVWEEEEGEPVSEHLLSDRLCSSEEQLWMRLGDCLAHQLREQCLLDAVKGGRGEGGKREKEREGV